MVAALWWVTTIAAMSARSRACASAAKRSRPAKQFVLRRSRHRSPRSSCGQLRARVVQRIVHQEARQPRVPARPAHGQRVEVAVGRRALAAARDEGGLAQRVAPAQPATAAATGRPAPRTRSRSWRRPVRRRACARCRATRPRARPRPAVPDAAAASPRRPAPGAAGRRAPAAISPQRGHAAVSPALHQGVAVAIAASRAKHAASCASQPGHGLRIGREHHDVGVAAGRQHFVEVRDFADAALAAACSRRAARVRCSQRSMIARPRGPACASSASQTRVPAACRRRARRGRRRARRRRRRPAAARSADASGGARAPRLTAASAPCCSGSIARKRRPYSSVRSRASCGLRMMVGVSSTITSLRSVRERLACRTGRRSPGSGSGPGMPEEPRSTPSLIRPASITVSPLWIAASVFSLRVLIADVAVAGRRHWRHGPAS